MGQGHHSLRILNTVAAVLLRPGGSPSGGPRASYLSRPRRNSAPPLLERHDRRELGSGFQRPFLILVRQAFTVIGMFPGLRWRVLFRAGFVLIFFVVFARLIVLLFSGHGTLLLRWGSHLRIEQSHGGAILKALPAFTPVVPGEKQKTCEA